MKRFQIIIISMFVLQCASMYKMQKSAAVPAEQRVITGTITLNGITVDDLAKNRMGGVKEMRLCIATKGMALGGMSKGDIDCSGPTLEKVGDNLLLFHVNAPATSEMAEAFAWQTGIPMLGSSNKVTYAPVTIRILPKQGACEYVGNIELNIDPATNSQKPAKISDAFDSMVETMKVRVPDCALVKNLGEITETKTKF